MFITKSTPILMSKIDQTLKHPFFNVYSLLHNLSISPKNKIKPSLLSRVTFTINTKHFYMEKKAKTDYDINPLIAHRWSPRVFADKAVETEKLHQLFEAARWAASSNNGQPWRFMFAKKGSDAYQTIFDHLADFNKQWCKNAPVLMLTAYKKQFDNGKDNFHAGHDLGLAIGNMSIQAQSLGLALHSMAGVNWQKAHETFNVPDGYHILTAVAIGYYGGDINDLPEDLQKAEKGERKRMKQTEFAGEDKWTF